MDYRRDQHKFKKLLEWVYHFELMFLTGWRQTIHQKKNACASRVPVDYKGHVKIYHQDLKTLQIFKTFFQLIHSKKNFLFLNLR